jgi:hypothetical protein
VDMLVLGLAGFLIHWGGRHSVNALLPRYPSILDWGGLHGVDSSISPIFHSGTFSTFTSQPGLSHGGTASIYQ